MEEGESNPTTRTAAHAYKHIQLVASTVSDRQAWEEPVSVSTCSSLASQSPFGKPLTFSCLYVKTQEIIYIAACPGLSMPTAVHEPLGYSS